MIAEPGKVLLPILVEYENGQGGAALGVAGIALGSEKLLADLPDDLRSSLEPALAVEWVRRYGADDLDEALLELQAGLAWGGRGRSLMVRPMGEDLAETALAVAHAVELFLKWVVPGLDGESFKAAAKLAGELHGLLGEASDTTAGIRVIDLQGELEQTVIKLSSSPRVVPNPPSKRGPETAGPASAGAAAGWLDLRGTPVRCIDATVLPVVREVQDVPAQELVEGAEVDADATDVLEANGGSEGWDPAAPYVEVIVAAMPRRFGRRPPVEVISAGWWDEAGGTIARGALHLDDAATHYRGIVPLFGRADPTKLAPDTDGQTDSGWVFQVCDVVQPCPPDLMSSDSDADSNPRPSAADTWNAWAGLMSARRSAADAWIMGEPSELDVPLTTAEKLAAAERAASVRNARIIGSSTRRGESAHVVSLQWGPVGQRSLGDITPFDPDGPLVADEPVVGGLWRVAPHLPAWGPYVELEDTQAAEWWLGDVVGVDALSGLRARQVDAALAEEVGLPGFERERMCLLGELPPLGGQLSRLAFLDWLDRWADLPGWDGAVHRLETAGALADCAIAVQSGLDRLQVLREDAGGARSAARTLGGCGIDATPALARLGIAEHSASSGDDSEGPGGETVPELVGSQWGGTSGHEPQLDPALMSNLRDGAAGEGREFVLDPRLVPARALAQAGRYWTADETLTVMAGVQEAGVAVEVDAVLFDGESAEPVSATGLDLIITEGLDGTVTAVAAGQMPLPESVQDGLPEGWSVVVAAPGIHAVVRTRFDIQFDRDAIANLFRLRKGESYRSPLGSIREPWRGLGLEQDAVEHATSPAPDWWGQSWVEEVASPRAGGQRS